MFSDGLMGDDERLGATGVAAALTAVVKAGEVDVFFTGSSFHAPVRAPAVAGAVAQGGGVAPSP
jgi:hypothetical protein